MTYIREKVLIDRIVLFFPTEGSQGMIPTDPQACRRSRRKQVQDIDKKSNILPTSVVRG